MLIDTHIHVMQSDPVAPDAMLRGMDENRIDYNVLFSDEPLYHSREVAELRAHNERRLANLLAWCKGHDRLLPVYFLNPTEQDAAAQVDRALEAGCIGFKVICETFYPGDERALPVYRYIASLGKSVLFHSGILWDWGDNGNFNRPCNWECMMQVPKARFALAHISWPWCDECISVYGKFCAMYDHPKYTGQQMYIDMTPGTPPIYREEVVRRLFGVQYWGMEDRLLFGTDLFTTGYDAASARAFADEEAALFDRLGVSREAQEKIFWKNAAAFWGLKL